MVLFTITCIILVYLIVALDQKLHKTIKGIFQGPERYCIVGTLMYILIVAEFVILYHEIGAITNI